MALQKKRPLPTWRDLPVSDGIPLDNANHAIQAMIYLREPLQRFLASLGRSAFISFNCFLYYRPGVHPAGPDFMVVNDGEGKEQGSWVVYSENDRFPTLIGEFLSPSSEVDDRNKKKERYRKLGTLDYFLYDTEDQRFEPFHLVEGVYVPAAAQPSGRVRCQSLPLELGVVGKWLRWFTLDGDMLPTAAERAEQERQKTEHERLRTEHERLRTEQERQRADQERQRADAAEARLAELERRLRQEPPLS